MNANHSLLGLAVASALAAPTPLLAQSTEAQLEEIVVTAQRREEQIQNVPVAITAFSGEDIAALGFTQMQDLATQTPNVQIKNVIANSIPNVTIRGVTPAGIELRPRARIVEGRMFQPGLREVLAQVAAIGGRQQIGQQAQCGPQPVQSTQRQATEKTKQ